jgi:integrase
MDSGRVTLADYVIKTWAPAYGSNLARKTQLHYEQLLVKHVLPELGPLELRAIYDLRHSFASLLLHEGRSVIYVARQLGHDARSDGVSRRQLLTLTNRKPPLADLSDR